MADSLRIGNTPVVLILLPNMISVQKSGHKFTADKWSIMILPGGLVCGCVRVCVRMYIIMLQ